MDFQPLTVEQISEVLFPKPVFSFQPLPIAEVLEELEPGEHLTELPSWPVEQPKKQGPPPTLEDNRLRQMIAETIEVSIDQHIEDNAEDEHRKHLGGSLIGASCSRQLWFIFRWAKRQELKARQLRIFNRGDREEPVLENYLRGIGCVLEHTADNQMRVSSVGGHFGGSLDNVGYLPPQFGITDKVMFEYKTMNASNWRKCAKTGVATSHPKYWSQMCVYGYLAKIRYAMFIFVNKDTDEIGIRIYRLDWEHGENLELKANSIIVSRDVPPPISRSSTNFACKWCHLKTVCFDGEALDRNCRTCRHSNPIDDKQWHCEKHDKLIDDKLAKTGCEDHVRIEVPNIDIS